MVGGCMVMSLETMLLSGGIFHAQVGVPLRDRLLLAAAAQSLAGPQRCWRMREREREVGMGCLCLCLSAGGAGGAGERGVELLPLLLIHTHTPLKLPHLTLPRDAKGHDNRNVHIFHQKSTTGSSAAGGQWPQRDLLRLSKASKAAETVPAGGWFHCVPKLASVFGESLHSS